MLQIERVGNKAEADVGQEEQQARTGEGSSELEVGNSVRQESGYRSENIAGEIFALRKFAQPGIDISRIDRERLHVLPGVERYLFEQLLHHGMQTTRADVFGAFVDRPRDFGQPADAVGVKSS
jgi:hypothetical protein